MTLTHMAVRSCNVSLLMKMKILCNIIMSRHLLSSSLNYACPGRLLGTRGTLGIIEMLFCAYAKFKLFFCQVWISRRFLENLSMLKKFKSSWSSPRVEKRTTGQKVKTFSCATSFKNASSFAIVNQRDKTCWIVLRFIFASFHFSYVPVKLSIGF